MTVADGPGIFSLMETAYAALVTEVHRQLDAAGFEDIRPAHGKVFETVGQDGNRITDMAEHAQITKGAMVELVDHLQRRGYLQRVADPSDGRAKIVRLTPRGWDAVGVAAAAIENTERRWADRVGQRNMQTLRRALRVLPEVLGEDGDRVSG